MAYKDKQKEIQKAYFSKNKKEMGGKYRGKEYDYFLKKHEDNFFSQDVYDDAVKYFKDNGIQWWNGKKPTSNTLSSQIACINHLFPIRQNHDAVLAIAQSIAQSIDSDFDDVEKLCNDKGDNGYISFEVVSATDHLNEARGKNKNFIGVVNALR